MSHHVKRFILAVLVMFIGFSSSAARAQEDVVLRIYSVGVWDSAEDRANAFNAALAIYVNAGNTFNPISNRPIAMYCGANCTSYMVQELMYVQLVNGQLRATATGNFGRFAKPAGTGSGGYGGACNPMAGSITTMETGQWHSWTVCTNGGCSTGSTWISTGLRILYEPVDAASTCML